jgi:hypothetical protein
MIDQATSHRLFRLRARKGAEPSRSARSGDLQGAKYARRLVAAARREMAGEVPWRR